MLMGVLVFWEKRNMVGFRECRGGIYLPRAPCKPSVTIPSPRQPTPLAQQVPLVAETPPSCGGSLNLPLSQPSFYPTPLPSPGWALPIMISPGLVPALGEVRRPILSLLPASSSLKPLNRAQFPRVQRRLEI